MEERMLKPRQLAATFVVAAVLVLAPPAIAQTGAWPTRAIQLIVPTPPAGGADFLARAVARRLGEGLGQPVVIENRPGAAGNMAAEMVARQPPDGYTLFIGAIAPLAISPTLYKTLPYDPVRDFAPITMGVVLSNILVAHPSLPAANVKELLALARAKPGTINYSSSGNATAGHLAGALFTRMGNVNMVHIPYKGGGPSIIDLLAGQVQISFASPPSVMQHVRSGKLKALGVTTDYRLTALPNVPTIAESGLPGFTANNWYCFVAPAGTPKDIVARLNQELRKALAMPETRAVLVEQGMDPAPGAPEELGATIKSEIAKWGEIVRAGKFTAE
jgi:tripartite-type tricarboxylate transporter receptor subunit TctC